MAIRYQAMPVIVLGADITNSFVKLQVPTFPLYQMVVTNSTSIDIVLSFDGLTRNIYVPAKNSFASPTPSLNVAFENSFYIIGIGPLAPGGQVTIQFVGFDAAATDGAWS